MSDLTVTVPQWQLDGIKEAVVHAVTEKVEEMFGQTVNAMIAARVAKLVDDVANDRIAHAVDEAIADGWRQTNSYGEAVGPNVTLKARIAQLLTEPTGDHYNGGRAPRGEKIAREVVEAALRGDFAKDIEAARKQFREMLDESVKARLADAIKQAFGAR